MFMGKVIGTVWSTVKWPQLEGLKLLLVRPYRLSDLLEIRGEEGSHRESGELEGVVCADLLDAGVGDDVVIAYGHAARVAVWESQGRPVPEKTQGSPPIPIDAAIVAVVDNFALAKVA